MQITDDERIYSRDDNFIFYNGHIMIMAGLLLCIFSSLAYSYGSFAAMQYSSGEFLFNGFSLTLISSHWRAGVPQKLEAIK